MKSVLGSLWFLTTCIGNILVIFFVEIKLWPTQTGEYFILSLIMFAASMIFVALSYFYYDYVPVAIPKKSMSDSDDAGVNNEAYSPENAIQDEQKSSQASLDDSAIGSDVIRSGKSNPVSINE